MYGYARGSAMATTKAAIIFKRTKSMKKITMLGSLAFSVMVYGYFLATGEGDLLAFVLLGLLVSFVAAMMFLTEK